MCEILVEDIVLNALMVAENANEFEEIKRFADGDVSPGLKAGKARGRRNQLNKLVEDEYMDYLFTVQEQRNRDKIESNDIRHSVKQTYVNYFKTPDTKKDGEPLENQEDF